MENITMDTATATTNQPSIMTVEIANENVALNILVSFINIAQKRGAFNLEESARIWECVQKFIIQPPAAPESASENA
jgi:hypothetical protein